MLVQIDYNLIFTAPFHVGTGISTYALDRTVVRDTQKNLYIPGSTFKGVVREQCEQLLRLYRPLQTLASPHNAQAVLSTFGQAPNLITRIFGSQLSPGGLRFDDSRQESSVHPKQTLQTSVLTQVRIDRLSGTGADNALFTSEFGNPLLTFHGMIKGQLDCTPLADLAFQAKDLQEGVYTLTPTYSLLLLLAGLLMVERIGSNKSSGKGACTCIITHVYLDRCTCREEEAQGEGWRAWLAHLDRLSSYSPEESKKQ